MMTIEERDTARAIQAIAKHLGNRAIDWEQRRYEIAKDAMKGILANPELYALHKLNFCLNTSDNGSGHDTIDDEYQVISDRFAAIQAVRYADALIKELQNNPIK